MTTDPHYGLESQLMRQGRKKLAYLNRPMAEAEGFVVERHLFNGESRYLVYRREDAGRASCWKRTDAMFSRGVISLATTHARRGILLDYDRDHIRRYVEERGQWEGLK